MLRAFPDMQDAAAGIINVAQNEVMKILTIASVAGIPPVLIAGIYGIRSFGDKKATPPQGSPSCIISMHILTSVRCG
jgi:magnesium transporter